MGGFWVTPSPKTKSLESYDKIEVLVMGLGFKSACWLRVQNSQCPLGAWRNSNPSCSGNFEKGGYSPLKRPIKLKS